MTDVTRSLAAWLHRGDRDRARPEAVPPKPDLLSAAAHELRTPLTTLLAQAQDLERRLGAEPDGSPELAAVQRMAREASRLRFLIQELLDAGAVEHGSLALDLEPADLVELARAASTARSGSTCVVQAAAPVIGMYDRQRMRVVFESLVDNSVKYGAGEPTRLLIWRQDGRAFVVVQDRGMGIPPEDLPRVFDRFHRGANATDQAVPGLGLGLYIARAIVRAHGGALALHSTPFEGTTVTVALPSGSPGVSPNA